MLPEFVLQSAVKVLADITPYTDYVDKLNSLFGYEKEGNEDGAMLHYPPFGKEDFLKDVYMQPDQYDRLVRLVKNKMNIIIEGAPGVGKTFTAKRLAYSMLGEKDPDRVEMIQFHQSYNLKHRKIPITSTSSSSMRSTVVMFRGSSVSSSCSSSPIREETSCPSFTPERSSMFRGISTSSDL